MDFPASEASILADTTAAETVGCFTVWQANNKKQKKM